MRLIELPPLTDPDTTTSVDDIGIAVYSLVKAETQFIYWEIFQSRCYTHDNWIEIGKDAVVFDVGANIGLFSLWTCFEPNTVKQVHAFEPLPDQFETLLANVELHGLNRQITPHRLAVGSTREEVFFTYYPNMPGNSTRWPDEKEELQKGKMSQSKFDGAVKVKVCVDTLSDIFAEENIERVDLLKVDVEGEELNVLLGINADDWGKIHQIILEVHDVDSRVATVTEMLKTNGFDVRIADDPKMAKLKCYTIAAKRLTSEW